MLNLKGAGDGMDLGDTQMRGTVCARARGEGDNGSDGEDEGGAERIVSAPGCLPDV